MSCPYVSYLLLLVIRCDMMIQYKKPMSEKYVFCSVLILLFLAWQKMLFHGNSQASVPFGTPLFALLCDSEILLPSFALCASFACCPVLE